MANNIQQAYSYFIGKGLSPHAAAGIVGNLKAESNVDPNSNQQGGPGRGIAQWSEGGRWETYKQWANGKNLYDLGNQLDFLWHELNTGYQSVLNTLQNTNSVQEATAVFMKDFEIPADTGPNAVAGRVALAQDVVGNNNATGGSSGGSGGTDNTRGQYGFTRPFLDAHPEIDQLITDAIQGDWEDQKFQARVENTKWWRNHDQAQRSFEILKGKDPDQARTDVNKQRKAIATMAQQMGVDLSKNEIADMAERAARNAWQSNDLQMHIGAQYQYRPKQGPETGYAATSISDLEAMASDYAVPISKQRLGKWTRDILQGQQTVEGYKDVLTEQAKNLYPHLSYSLNNGGTVRSWADPYLQSAAQMLGVSPDTMRLDKGKWAGLLDPTKDGKPMTMSQWQTKVRTENAYGYDSSPEALSQADDFIAQMGQIMGAR